MDIPFLPLVEWHTRWPLIGDQISCKGCGRCQPVTDTLSFGHVFHCPFNSREVNFPGRELAKVLQQKIETGI